MLELPPLSLYIHIPWCVKKCPYCDFNSHEMQQGLPEREYVAALCEDFDQDYADCESRPVESIFIGGGTPSLFSAESIGAILNHVQSVSSFTDQIEITLEANPGTAEAQKFKDYRAAGVNRLSLGIQSFSDKQLKNLGRIHNAQESIAAIGLARQAGFDNINLDLMHGLPAQSPSDALNDLQTAIDFAPEHLSWYQLTIEPNTVFHARPPSLLPDDVAISDQEDAGNILLEKLAYKRYEVSAFALEGRQSRHNLNYWQFGDYIGIGAGAHGKLSNAEQQAVSRTRKFKQPDHYLQSNISRRAETTAIDQTELPVEFLLNALRTRQGFTRAMFESRTGLPFSGIEKKVEYLSSNKLMQEVDGWVSTTDRGFRMLNNLLQEFL
ncbi:MAG: YggW family oxidoreductase [SAR86 cluster bacterium]|uniref:Heme chaperone HemW n=1 Tax=SAR86 cluster bacterium TaxID=2030880 RepID=A0A2A5B9M5_9GAMM|nr:MAG: YggW family oxidoreductase [SAR86 cluster bacterium]